MLLYNTFIGYKIYKDNQIVTTNNITSRICSVNVEYNTPYCYCKINGFKTIAVAPHTVSFQCGYCIRVPCHLCACTMLNVDSLGTN